MQLGDKKACRMVIYEEIGCMKLSKQAQAELMLVGTTLIWGSTFLITKLLLTAEHVHNSPFALLALRFAVATIIAALFLAPRRMPSANEILGGCVIGFFSFGGFVFQTIGLQSTTPAKSGFITSLFVLFIPFISIFWERKRIPKSIFWALIPAFLGLWAISNVGFSIAQLNPGDKITLLSAVCYAFQIVAIQVFTQKDGWMWQTVLHFATIFVASLIGMSFEETASLSFTLPSLAGIFYLAIFASVGALGLQMYAQRFTTSARASLIYIFEPICAALFAFLFAGHGMSGMEILGASLIFLSMLIGRCQ